MKKWKLALIPLAVVSCLVFRSEQEVLSLTTFDREIQTWYSIGLDSEFGFALSYPRTKRIKSHISKDFYSDDEYFMWHVSMNTRQWHLFGLIYDEFTSSPGRNEFEWNLNEMAWLYEYDERFREHLAGLIDSGEITKEETKELLTLSALKNEESLRKDLATLQRIESLLSDFEPTEREPEIDFSIPDSLKKYLDKEADKDKASNQSGDDNSE